MVPVCRTWKSTPLTPPGARASAVACRERPAKLAAAGEVMLTCGVVTGLQVAVFVSHSSLELQGGLHSDDWHLALTQICPPTQAGKQPPFGTTQTFREGSHFDPALQSVSELQAPGRPDEQAAAHTASRRMVPNRIGFSQS